MTLQELTTPIPISGFGSITRSSTNIGIALRNHVLTYLSDHHLIVLSMQVELMGNNTFQACLDALDPDNPKFSIMVAFQAFEHAIGMIDAIAEKTQLTEERDDGGYVLADLYC